MSLKNRTASYHPVYVLMLCWYVKEEYICLWDNEMT